MTTDPTLPYPGPPPRRDPPGPGPGGPRENGAGLAALVLGIVALACAVTGFLIITIPVALAAGGLAVYFGVRGRRLAARGEADNPGRSLAGLVMGSVALGLVVVGGTALAVTHDHWDHRWHRGNDDAMTFDRCLDQADGRAEVGACLRAYPDDARALGVTVQP